MLDVPWWGLFAGTFGRNKISGFLRTGHTHHWTTCLLFIIIQSYGQGYLSTKRALRLPIPRFFHHLHQGRLLLWSHLQGSKGRSRRWLVMMMMMSDHLYICWKQLVVLLTHRVNLVHRIRRGFHFVLFLLTFDDVHVVCFIIFLLMECAGGGGAHCNDFPKNMLKDFRLL